jgi:hypothetical protein
MSPPSTGSRNSMKQVALIATYLVLAKLCLLLASCWFLAWRILWSWRLMRNFPPKRWLNFNGLHGAISQKKELLFRNYSSMLNTLEKWFSNFFGSRRTVKHIQIFWRTSCTKFKIFSRFNGSDYRRGLDWQLNLLGSNTVTHYYSVHTLQLTTVDHNTRLATAPASEQTAKKTPQSQSQSYFTTDDQSVSKSWFQGPWGSQDMMFISVDIYHHQV